MREYTARIQLMAPLRSHQEIETNQKAMQELQTVYNNHPEDSEEANDARIGYTTTDLYQQICTEVRDRRSQKKCFESFHQTQ